MPSLFRRLESAELAYAAERRLRKEDLREPIIRATLDRIIRSEYRSDESAIPLSHRSPLQSARAMIARGNTCKAETLLKVAEKQNLESDERCEVILQRTRLNTWKGSWDSVIQDASIVLGNENSSVLSRSAAFQLRANAWFECRHFTRADNDLRSLEKLTQLLPNGQIAFYGQLSRIKLTARLADINAAQSLFHAFWDRWVANLQSANLDELLTCIRIALDLGRLDHKDTFNLAIASSVLSHALGDETYLGLAWIDVWATAHSCREPVIFSQLKTISESQPRVRKLLTEIRASSPEGVTETALNIRNYGNRYSTAPTWKLPNIGTIKGLVCTRSWLAADLTRKRLHRLNVQPRIQKVIRILSAGPITKELLFQKAWGVSHFHPLRHDPIVRTALMRAREQAQIETISREDQIAISPSFWLISDL